MCQAEQNQLQKGNTVGRILFVGAPQAGKYSLRSSWLQAAQLWCTDNQFEYVEASSTDRKLDESLVWDEQQQGVCRIKQALEANYWPGNTESDPNGFEDFQSADEADLDQFDTMFGELHATRDRLQDLPRDQRQLAAADVALRIAAILGLNEESDDEESS
ncbi:hypothetical protein WJX82_005291 [Trebouxia sp. C0006]